MKLVRIDKLREIEENVEIIRIEIDGREYTIKERFGKININAHDGYLSVYPGCANQIDVGCELFRNILESIKEESDL